MSIHDDPRKKATPPAKPKTASYKQGSKNAVNKSGGKTGRKNMLNQRNAHEVNPLSYLLDCEAKPRKKEHKVDPFMIRQAKLLAAKQGA